MKRVRNRRHANMIKTLYQLGCEMRWLSIQMRSLKHKVWHANYFCNTTTYSGIDMGNLLYHLKVELNDIKKQYTDNIRLIKMFKQEIKHIQ